MGEENEKAIFASVEILEKKGTEIFTVSEWANKTGLSRAHFSRSFTREFGINPKDYLKDFKLRAISQEIKKSPTAIGYKIAVNVGFIDDKALYKYLSFHCNMTLTEYKKQVV